LELVFRLTGYGHREGAVCRSENSGVVRRWNTFLRYAAGSVVATGCSEVVLLAGYGLFGLGHRPRRAWRGWPVRCPTICSTGAGPGAGTQGGAAARDAPPTGRSPSHGGARDRRDGRRGRLGASRGDRARRTRVPARRGLSGRLRLGLRDQVRALRRLVFAARRRSAAALEADSALAVEGGAAVWRAPWRRSRSQVPKTTRA